MTVDSRDPDPDSHGKVPQCRYGCGRPVTHFCQKCGTYIHEYS